MDAQVVPFDPDHVCPACGAQGAEPARHARPVLIVFGSAPQWPCGGEEMQRRVQDHLCLRCTTCQHAWMESTPAAAGS